MTDSEQFEVGSRLKELRQSAGLSQRQLADLASVPHGQISMIETGRSSPSVASLRKILGGMSITMSDFFAPDKPLNQEIFFTPNDLIDLTSQLYKDDNPEQARISLKQVGNAKAHNLQILQERYEPGADTGKTHLEHDANEGGIVISGEIELTVGDQTRILKAGDSFLFDSNQPHRFRNVSDRPAEVVSACTPPYL
ncbi:cupin domain-containing protein [Cohaesibacter gelatinilyticus]|uniref:Transcriptional regulator, XRE family with cupin sensor n=1 Tax=Cohaesibacter gelatinilyticus TaxID=372072 RepID=A0A285NHN0_9HYPH|nr:cupin domain-containing protein [Cohaesibacter gelatinilyticus]SNZ08423.1 transcriptional regulator, XRE family with cupin sensor [Cohaesibacter gelatinilyticus]